MFQPDNYTARLLDLSHKVKVLNAETGTYRCEGFAAVITEDYPARCECEDFKADGECIHIDAIGYVLDTGALPA